MPGSTFQATHRQRRRIKPLVAQSQAGLRLDQFSQQAVVDGLDVPFYLTGGWLFAAAVLGQTRLPFGFPPRPFPFQEGGIRLDDVVVQDR